MRDSRRRRPGPGRTPPPPPQSPPQSPPPPTPQQQTANRSTSQQPWSFKALLAMVLLGALALSAPSPASAQDNLVRGASGGVSTSASGAKPGAAGGGEHGHHSFECSCMEYWTCVTSGGEIYSYCGIGDGEVCCFVPRNAEPVGILPTPSRARCGKKGFDSGQEGEADMAEWPWHAAILEKPQDLYVCGSTLLDESWILTAAHCVDDYLPFVSTISEILKVRLGEYDVSTTAEPLRHEEFNITDIVIYPGFNNSTLVHDIALLKLERPAKRKQNIDVVCMPKPGDFTHSEAKKNSRNSRPSSSSSSSFRSGGVERDLDLDHKCYVTGWGRRTESSEHSLVLKEISVPLWSHATCNGALQAQFGPAYHLPDTAVCAGAEGRDACDGDGGGPLVCEKGGQWYQVGIVSFGIGCGRPNVPGVYTSVAEYEEWVEEVILTEKRERKRKEERERRAGRALLAGLF